MSSGTTIDEAPSGRNFVTSLHSLLNSYGREITLADVSANILLLLTHANGA